MTEEQRAKLSEQFKSNYTKYKKVAEGVEEPKVLVGDVSIKDFILQTISDERLATRCAGLVSALPLLRGYVLGHMHRLSEVYPEGCKTEAELRVVFNRLCYIEEE